MGDFYPAVGVTDTVGDHSGFKLRRKPLDAGKTRVRSKVVWREPECAAVPLRLAHSHVGMTILMAADVRFSVDDVVARAAVSTHGDRG